ncbi:hypothetical protein ACEUDJ_00640 [Aeromonas bivalvium]|uniref:DUF3106 domain-containing protein n=1 Tax=Aeromonas bivalvium TaxID=440079 RepID=A0ABW9GJQ6_9GAMM
MRLPLILALTALGLGGCSTPSSTVSAGMGYGSGYGAAPYPWWYDDYFYYWDRYYPWCCNNDGEFDELIRHWWQDLDEGKRADIKNRFEDWHQGTDQPDIEALRGDFSARWNALSPEQKAVLRDRQQVLRQLSPATSPPFSLSEANEAARRIQLDGQGAGRAVTLPASRPAPRPVTMPVNRPAHMMNMPVIRRR